ncbi:hypothetical protein HD554DRAFT_2121898 [Boletus coccyginus]|nr:hypothetical protein HD554DRAFT_2121898 [Boletus coccyginus]
MTNPSSQDPSKVTGQFHSIKGTVVESAGDMTGSQAWSQAGKEEHARGEGEYKAAQAKGYVEGATDTVGGYKDSVVGAVTGDKSQQAAGNARNEKGQTQQEVNKP